MADEPTIESLTAENERLQGDVTRIAADRDQAVRAKQRGKELSAEERQELTDLRATQEAGEESRLRQAGEFDTLKEKLEREKAESDTAATDARSALAASIIETAFHGAHELFGPDGLTTLTPEFGLAGFRSHVRYVPAENGTPARTEVLGLDGEPIKGENGESASFTRGMAQLIDQWPTKDAILRAAGRTGSGAGESHDDINVESASRAEIVAAAVKGDPAAIKRLQATQPATQVSGRHWENAAAD